MQRLHRRPRRVRVGYFDNLYVGSDANTWKYRTTVTQPDKTPAASADNDYETVYTNHLGEPLLKIFHETATGKEWRTAWAYDSLGRTTLRAEPSAVSSALTVSWIGTTASDLLGYNAATGDYAKLNDTAGVITRTTYYAATTAADTSSPDASTLSERGGVKGYVNQVLLQRGDGGGENRSGGPLTVPVPQEKYEYYSHENAATGAVAYVVARRTTYKDDAGSVALNTDTEYTWYANSLRARSAAVSRPAVASGDNGPGTADVETTFFNAAGHPVWTKDADGHITYTEYDPVTGGVTKYIRDVNTGSTSDFTGLPSGWSNASGLHLKATYAIDALGRETRRTDPNGNVTYTVYDDVDDEVRVYPGWNASTHTTTGPVVVYREDRDTADAAYAETLTMAPTSIAYDSTTGAPTGGESIANVLGDARDYFNNAGQHVRTEKYHAISSWSAAGTSGATAAPSGAYRTELTYDGADLERVKLATGTITRYVYDGRHHLASVWVGTDDTPTSGYWSASNTAGANMGKVAEYVYDDGGAGDGNLTCVVQHVSFVGTAAGTASDDRRTDMAYDWRNRLVATKSGATSSASTESQDVQRQVTYYAYGNLGRNVLVEQYDGDRATITTDANADGVPDRPTYPSGTTTASRLRGKSTTEYDARGRVFATHLFGVTPNGTNAGAITSDSLTTSYWYDRRGNVIKVAEPGGLVTKTLYDGAGRPTKVYRTDGGNGSGGVESSYVDAGTVSGDAVLTQTETQYDANGNAIFTIAKERFHTESGTGALGGPLNAPYARVSYVERFYDAAGRLTATADLGTGPANFLYSARPHSSPPGRSDNVLVTSYGYDAAGNVETVTDPRGLVTKVRYDALGRTARTVENFLDETPGDDNDRITDYTYDGSGHVRTMTAVLPDGPDGGTAYDEQVTEYVYAASSNFSHGINSNEVLTATKYPDTLTGEASLDELEMYNVNAQGERTVKVDGNGTRFDYTRDALGRLTREEVTVVEPIVDAGVKALAYTFDSAGRPYQFTSYAAGGTALNQVRREYNGFGQLVKEYQSVYGIGASGVVQYAYSEASEGGGPANHSRLKSVTYPSGKVITHNYASGVDARISRLSSISDTGGTLEGYRYLGLGTVVRREHPQPGVDLTYADDGQTYGNIYTGLDRFGRVTTQRWVDGAGADVDSFSYGYDRDGNRLWKQNDLSPTKGELYAYDGLNRVTNFQRGELNATQTGLVGTATRSQGWDLDGLGNWQALTTDGVAQDREHNAQNQLTEVGAATLAYDGNGSAINDDKGNTLVYDAWNRLVRVSAPAGNVLALYGYDALGRRTYEKNLAALPGTEVTLTGTSGNDSFTISAGAGGALEVRLGATLLQTVASGQSVLLHFDGNGGDDSLSVGAGTVHLLDDAADSGTSLALSVSGSGTHVQLVSERQHLSSLSIGSGAKLTLQPGREGVLVVAAGGLSVASGGTLDVADNGMVLRSTATTNEADLLAVRDLAASGRDGGGWTGTGITSSVAATAGDHWVGVGQAIYMTFDGDTVAEGFRDESVSNTDVLVRFTYLGDADLNGSVNDFDVTIFGMFYDGGATTDNTWYQGDFDYDGRLDADDLMCIDANYYTNSPSRMNPLARTLFYSDRWQVLEERQSKHTAARHVWSPAGYVDQLVLRERDTDRNGSLDERLYALQDANHNVTALVNTAGAVVERYQYDPYGTPTVLDPAGGADADGLSDFAWSYLHQGGRRDSSTGLYHFRHRDYDPALGRWLQQDPAGYVDGANLYQAVLSNPETHRDPAGLMTPDEFFKMTPQQKQDWISKFNDSYRQLIDQAAQKYCVPKQLLSTVIANEQLDYTTSENLWDNWLGFGNSMGVAQVTMTTAIGNSGALDPQHIDKSMLRHFDDFWSYLRSDRGSIDTAASIVKDLLAILCSDCNTGSTSAGFMSQIASGCKPDQLCLPKGATCDQIVSTKVPSCLSRSIVAMYNNGPKITRVANPRASSPNGFSHAYNSDLVAGHF